MTDDPSAETPEQAALRRAQRNLKRRFPGSYVPAEDLPDEEQGLILAYEERLFIGPLPHPELLAGYERASPGSAERIIAMAEKQGDHRRTQEDRLLRASIASEKRGQLLAFLLASLVCGGGIYLLAIGKGISGLVALLAPLASLIGIFIYTARQQREPKAKPRDKMSERREPAEEVSDPSAGS